MSLFHFVLHCYHLFGFHVQFYLANICKKSIHIHVCMYVCAYIWRARCDFGPPFTKPPNHLLSCNVTAAKWIVSCSQHTALVIWIEFPPKLHQMTLPLARKEKLPKCQEIPIISAGGKNQFCCCPWWMWLWKKQQQKSQTRLAAMDYLDRKRCSRNFLHSKMANFVLPVILSSATFSD